MPTFIPPQFEPWFDGLCRAIGLQGDAVARARENGGFTLAGVPIMLAPPAVGAEDHVVLQALLGVLPPAPHRVALLEYLLEWQLMTCGPVAPVFGMEQTQQTMLLLSTVRPDQLTVEDGAVSVRALASLAKEWIPLLQENSFLAASAAPLSDSGTASRHALAIRRMRR